MDRHEDERTPATGMDWHAREAAPYHDRLAGHIVSGGVQVAHRTGGARRSAAARGRSAATDRRKGVRMDHRQGGRYRVFRLVAVQYDDSAQAPGLLYNVSRNGMFVLTNARPGVNDCVDVCIRSANGGEEVSISAQVVYHTDHGVGLIFREVGGHAETVIEGLCA